MLEVWKTVVIDGIENPRYQVSNLGRVVNLNYMFRGEKRICSQSIDKYGYKIVSIDRYPKLVHRLVAEAFLPNPQNKPCIDHIDTNRQRNVIEVDENGVPVEKSTLTNIRWATNKENNNNPLTLKKNYMLGKLNGKHPNAIEIVQLTLDGQFIKKWSCAVEAGRELGICQSDITKCCKGKKLTAGGFKWMYLSDWLKVCKSEAV